MKGLTANDASSGVDSTIWKRIEENRSGSLATVKPTCTPAACSSITSNSYESRLNSGARFAMPPTKTASSEDHLLCSPVRLSTARTLNTQLVLRGRFNSVSTGVSTHTGRLASADPGRR